MKKYILIVIPVVTCLVLAGCGNSDKENNTKVSNQEVNQEIQNIVSKISEKDQKQYSLAMQKKDESYCDKIEDSNYKK
jgi:outer membrane murein-binding lipoprotein Lpp